ncbi:hypothetical protein [uncultured Alistipes sp.]|jgi:hypothetical protein|uniref:hypothetical protein n=1 Tax=uncultured Alistipes sp. TaxID=538949 RepID=UPI0025FCF726|nr:hypothetical protein [uncultured Alistipes sp.]
MKLSFTYFEPVVASTASKMDVDAFDRSIELFDDGSYHEALLTLLDYINPDLRKQYGNPEQTRFSIPHGSIIVNLEIANERLKITAPFVALPEKGRIPLLRQVASLNINVLDLPCIAMENGELFFRYDCPLMLTHPAKIYDILYDICTTGDRYDDEFATKFGAQRIYEPQITPYDEATVSRIYDNLQQLCGECLDGVKFFEADRMFGYCWNLLSTTLYQIFYFTNPQGELLNSLDKAIREMNRNDIPQTEVIARGKEDIRKLQAIPREQLAASLYFVGTFISDKRRSNLKNIQDNFKETFDNASSYLEAGNDRACYVIAVNKFYEMYYYNNVQDDVNNVVSKALAASSAKPWEEAAPILHEAMRRIMEDELDEETDANELAGNIFGNMDMQAVQDAAQAMQAQMQQAMQGLNMEEYMKNMMAMFGGQPEDENK